MKSSRSAVVFALVALVAAGFAAAALASGKTKSRPRRAPHHARVLPALPCAIPVPSRTPLGPQSPSPAPSKALLSAFGVLRRDREDSDSLPARAISELRARGASFNPAAARLLRTTRTGGKAWVVPVGDVHVLDAGGCGLSATFSRGVASYQVAPPIAYPVRVPSLKSPPRAAAPRQSRRRAAARRRRLGQVRSVLRRLQAQRRALQKFIPASPAKAAEPEEGIAVVAVGDAPGGGGGAMDDVIRGRSEPETRPCAGIGHDLISVSGVVPDGVDQAFLTSPDGTAVKADVNNNSYAFLVAPLSSPAARYVVWLNDGLPHVQAVPPVAMRMACVAVGPKSATDDVIDITPGRLGGLLSAMGVPAEAPPAFYALPKIPPTMRRRAVPAKPATRPLPPLPRTATPVPATPHPVPRTPIAPPPAAVPARP